MTRFSTATYFPLDRLAHGAFMNSMLHLVPLVAPFVLLAHITPTWGGPPNPTMSDTNGNTAGGSLALQNVVQTPTGGSNNTAGGNSAPAATTRRSASKRCAKVPAPRTSRSAIRPEPI